MDPTGIAAAAAVLTAALAFASFRRLRDGRFRAPRTVPASAPTAAALRDLTDGRPTFLQFSGELCSQCRSNERVFAQVVAAHPGIGFRDLDVAEHLELVRELGILRSPTVLFVQPSGAVVARAHGALDHTTVRQLIGAHHD